MILDYLEFATKEKASDIILQANTPAYMKIGGVVGPVEENKLTSEDMETMLLEIYDMCNRKVSVFRQSGDDDFSLVVPNLGRFRINTCRQMGNTGIIIRLLSKEIPTPEKMHIPVEIMNTVDKRSGLILVAGTAGSGKTTTQACLIDRINSTRTGHIITLEDPVEFVHKNKKSIITQRDVMLDSSSFAAALRASLRQAPDVILVGEMRDFETMQTALTAAETGHLVIATIHTAGAAQSIDRIVDSFPADQQPQIKTQLSMNINSIISQKLIISKTGDLYPAFELLSPSTSMRHFIRSGETQKLANALINYRGNDTYSIEEYLLRMLSQGIITEETALESCFNGEFMKTRISGLNTTPKRRF